MACETIGQSTDDDKTRPDISQKCQKRLKTTRNCCCCLPAPKSLPVLFDDDDDDDQLQLHTGCRFPPPPPVRPSFLLAWSPSSNRKGGGGWWFPERRGAATKSSPSERHLAKIFCVSIKIGVASCRRPLNKFVDFTVCQKLMMYAYVLHDDDAAEA